MLKSRVVLDIESLQICKQSWRRRIQGKRNSNNFQNRRVHPVRENGGYTVCIARQRTRRGTEKPPSGLKKIQVAKGLIEHGKKKYTGMNKTKSRRKTTLTKHQESEKELCLQNEKVESGKPPKARGRGPSTAAVLALACKSLQRPPACCLGKTQETAVNMPDMNPVFFLAPLSGRK